MNTTEIVPLNKQLQYFSNNTYKFGREERTPVELFQNQ